MTTQSSSSPTVRETSALHRGRSIIVEIHAGFIVARHKGSSERWAADYESLIDWLEMREAKRNRGDIPPRTIRRGR